MAGVPYAEHHQARLAQTVQPWVLELGMPSDGWLSSNERLSWQRKADRTKVLRRLAYLKGRQHRCPRLDAAHVVLWFRFRDRRRRDVANLHPTAKAIIDGLIDAHLLPDDDDTRLLGPDLRTGTPLPAGPLARPLVMVVVHPLALAEVTGTTADPTTDPTKNPVSPA